jgi:NADH-quinone oxidoreductase subunit G
MARIHIDNTPFDVDPTRNLLDVCLSLGFDLPYFCWHPALGSVGACRQCAVTQYRETDDTSGRIVMACMEPAKDGTRIAINDAQSTDFRARVIEWLMANHPHDCPVCEEGGECHLQDMTVMTGHVYRRYRFPKRTFRNQDLGPFITHEMNRCITCYRCVRFYGDYAGGTDLRAFASKDHVYFGREADGALENEFSGNLVEVCPTGVFDDKTFSEHYTRKWDLQSAPSVCVHCGLGCNTHVNERYGEVRRVLDRYHRDINGYFLCDRGRFGYGFVNSDKRVRLPLVRRERGDIFGPATRNAILAQTVDLLRRGPVIGIGSPRASLEANFALRELAGPERFFAGLSSREQHLLGTVRTFLQNNAVPIASLHDAEQADAVLVLGEDVPNTAPRLALSLRQSVRQRGYAHAARLGIPLWQDITVREAVQEEKSPLFVITAAPTRLDTIAHLARRAAPDDIARLGFAMAHALDGDAPPVPDLAPHDAQLAQTIAAALRAAERPVVVSGTGSGSDTVIEAAANIAAALQAVGCAPSMCLVVPECNSLGLTLLKPGTLRAAVDALPEKNATVIVLENDLYRRASRVTVDTLLAPAHHVIVLDHLLHETALKADLVLPAATFAEADGTLVNNEGRAQRFFQVFVPGNEIRESWRWLRDVGRSAGVAGMAWDSLDDVIQACARAVPALADIARAAPGADFRIAGMRIAREPNRYSGRTAVVADLTVHEPKPPSDPDSPLAYSMEGYQGKVPAPVIPLFWAPRWNSNESLNKFQSEINGRLPDGPAGVRLFGPAARRSYATRVPPAFRARPGEWLFVPLYQVFGSDELSRYAPAVAARSEALAVWLNPIDATRLSLSPEGIAEVYVNGVHAHLPVRVEPNLPAGLAGLSVGAPPLQGVVLPAWGRLEARA